MPKNVIHVLSSFKVGGAERLVLDLAQVQTSEGDRVAVFSCNSAQDPLFGEFANIDVEGLLSTGKRLSDYQAIWQRFKSGKNSVLHIHSPAALRYLGPLLPFLKIQGVSLVYTRHGVAPLEKWSWSLVHAWARLFMDTATFVSDVGLEVFYERFNWRWSMLMTVSNGVFVPKDFNQEAFDGRPIKIGSVGRMVELKAQSHLVQVLADIQKEKPVLQLQLHFFGDGPERKSLITQAERLLKKGTAEFHGMQLNREKVYGDIDLLVVCSEQEGLSLAIMEAMARGIPVVATAVGDSPKLVVDGQTGYLYDYADLPALKSRLMGLLEAPGQIRLLGDGAREHIREQYSLQKTNRQYQSVY